ncbi:sigma-54 interaction domain-containing protein [Polaromonas sp. JS666]|uniref:sigma-54 interaction domain-containing protein n=1 Tax=Polaromonas sp. (strain JS666 / ATCC BAA-500) TaxID=296591 RepID=UPI0000D5B490|nr:sigma 54-interacting transcriptional regulator [Polaromonas sp. JS666]ABE47048.1 sigma54 specific transcriptional regulator with PAS sensor, Fis family [Polaromonas sp. JS666]
MQTYENISTSDSLSSKTEMSELLHLRQLCKDFEEIYRNSFDGIFVADGKGITLMVNEGCERNYDLKAEELVGHHVSEFEKKGWIRPVIATRVAAERKRISAMQHTHTGKTIMVTGIPLFDDQGAVRKVIINSRDTTELVQLQEALLRTREDLQRVENEMKELRLQNLKPDGVALKSQSMQRLSSLALRVAKVDTAVLISGESGVGKEVLARQIHKESQRSQGPLIKINCGAIPRELLESELFGYEGGAFTGALKQGKVGLIETAHHGTLFLDEIGELPMNLQVKLLQTLQDHTVVRVGGTRVVHVDLRVIAATNRDLQVMVDNNQFRSDLYYRLNVVPLSVPPLRLRKEDIFPLTEHALDELNASYSFNKRFSERALKSLLTYEWPGNVRELRNIVERLVVTTPTDLIDVIDLPEYLIAPVDQAFADPLEYRAIVAQFEKQLVAEALKKYGNTRAVAKQLNLSQSTVVRKLNAA